MRIVTRLVRAWRLSRQRRRLARVARQVDIFLALCESSPDIRKHVRKVLRVRGYES